MHNLDKAREWAESVSAGPATDRAHAAAKVIQSLPDQWVDAEEAREVLFHMVEDSLFEESLHPHVNALERLLAPKLPTLAELIEQGNDPQKYVGMQCIMQDFPSPRVITEIRDSRVLALREDLVMQHTTIGKVTPLPDFPKLQWPGGVVDAEIVDETPADQQPNSSETPKSSPQPKMGEWWQVEEERNGKGVGKLVEDAGDYPWLIYLNDGTHDFFKRGSVTPITRMVPEIPAAPDEKTSPDQAVTKDVCNNPRPEDVPADELWLVEFDGNEWVGKRNRGDEDTFTWRVASLGIKGSGMAEDSDMTLIHKLVPETHTLPKGMRLADHETYGRVVVSQRADEDDDYAFFESIPGGVTGSSWGYANESELTFLGGAQ